MSFMDWYIGKVAMLTGKTDKVEDPPEFTQTEQELMERNSYLRKHFDSDREFLLYLKEEESVVRDK